VKSTGSSPRPQTQIVTQNASNRGTQIQVHPFANTYQIKGGNGNNVQTIPVNQLSPQGTLQV